MIHYHTGNIGTSFLNSGKLPALKIKEPGTLIAYSEDEISDTVFSTNINLVTCRSAHRQKYVVSSCSTRGWTICF